MYFTEEQLGDLMVVMEKSNQNVTQVTLEWMNENEDLAKAEYSIMLKRW